MAHPRFTFLLFSSTFALSLAVGCASPAVEEEESSGNAITGSPTQERATADAAHLTQIEEAYDASEMKDFTDLDGGAGLPGDALRDYRQLAKSCVEHRLEVNAQKWTVALPSSVDDDTPKPRTLFTVDAFDRDNSGETRLVGIYDEKGRLVVGRQFALRGGFLRTTPKEYEEKVATCDFWL